MTVRTPNALFVACLCACGRFGGVAAGSEPGHGEVNARLDALSAELVQAREHLGALEAQVKAIRDELARPEAGRFPRPVAADESEAPAVFRIPCFNRKPVKGVLSLGEILVVVAPGGETVVAADPKAGKTWPLSLATGKARVRPVFNGSAWAVALRATGPKVERVAVLDFAPETREPVWHRIDLREPVREADPEVRENYVLYPLGRYVYAFSVPARRWDVLELPAGSVPKPRRDAGEDGPCFESDGHLYTFQTRTGIWKDLDTRAILDQAGNPGRSR